MSIAMGLSPHGIGCDIFEQSGRNSNRMRNSMSISGTKASPPWNTIVETTRCQPTFPNVKRTHCNLRRKKSLIKAYGEGGGVPYPVM